MFAEVVLRQGHTLRNATDDEEIFKRFRLSILSTDDGYNNQHLGLPPPAVHENPVELEEV